MRGLKNRPKLRGTVPFNMSGSELEAMLLADKSTPAMLKIKAKNVAGVSKEDAQEELEALQAIINGKVAVKDPNFFVPKLGQDLVLRAFKQRYPFMAHALVAPPRKPEKPDMVEKFTRGTAAFRKVRKEISDALGLRDAGHNVGHGANSTAKDNRGEMIENLLQHAKGPARNSAITKAKFVFGYNVKRD